MAHSLLGIYQDTRNLENPFDGKAAAILTENKPKLMQSKNVSINYNVFKLMKI